MADFSDRGKHCEDPYCRQKDLLPLCCDACGKTYCSVHFRYQAHSCPKGFAGKDRRAIVCPICGKGVPMPAGEDENAVFARHEASADCRRHTVEAAAKPRCPAKGCKEKLTTLNAFKCGTCGKQAARWAETVPGLALCGVRGRGAVPRSGQDVPEEHPHHGEVSALHQGPHEADDDDDDD
ncbi:unnamed protein product, partial [Prorocentrum cordatum]